MATPKVKKRNGSIADFEPAKITVAVQKAFAAVLGDSHDKDAIAITKVVVDTLEAKFGNTAFIPTVEDVQDLVEMALMERGYFGVAKDYIIYRYEHQKLREEKREEVAQRIEENALMIEKRDGSREHFSEEKLTRSLQFASVGYEALIDTPAIISRVRQEMYDGIKTKEIHDVLIMVTRSLIERDPSYSYVAARLLLQYMYREAIGDIADYTKLEDAHKAAFVRNIARGVETGWFDKEMMSFNLPKLADALVIERDNDFKYLGLQTLQSNYLSKEVKTRKLLETPQMFWMRVAMGCALAEKTPEAREAQAIEFYEIMSAMYYMPSSPTLYHAGTTVPQLSSCFLSTVPDDLHAIFDEYKDGAQLLKYAGGLGVDWSYIRAAGSLVSKTGVESQGVVPFLRIENDVTISINRSGRRRGATAVYLEYWHLEIEDFMELRKNTGDERRRAHDLNTATWIPDLFMKRLGEDGQWTLFSPSDVPDLHDLYGRRFDEAYERYEKMAQEGNLKHHKVLCASDLWRKHITMLFESGHPWITWKDPSNIRSPQDHVGVVHSSNLCTEITLNTSATETAVCNLGSLNLGAFVTHDAKFDRDLVARVVPVAMRMLDNVIDVNFYPTQKTRNSNMRHRPVGLGLRGLMDALYKMGINFDTDEAVTFSDESQEVISYHAILSSALLAKERGTYETYKGSKWDRGILPQDTLALLEAERGMKIDVPRHEILDWRLVREAVRQWGMRNSNTQAHAPTATTANIAGCYPTVEPIYKNIYVKSNMAGDFMIVNEFLVADLKALGLWNADMLEKIKFHDGSVQSILEIPPAIREKYKEVFEMEPQWLIKAAAYRGRWIDQSQSLNIFYGGTSGRVLSEIYQYAWSMGLKTTYYLRTMGASRVEKSTIDSAKHQVGLVSDGVASPVASSVVIQETVTVVTQDTLMAQATQAHNAAEAVSMMSVGQVVADVEQAQVQAGQMELIEAAKKAPYAELAHGATAEGTIFATPTAALGGSKGVPTFGGAPVAVANRPKIEVLSEPCESCSA
ncbi:MAG TPA: ribonucleoside-diphosphate reductase subunit alpha [Candidatus Paceibacterota bacterium]